MMCAARLRAFDARRVHQLVHRAPAIARALASIRWRDARSRRTSRGLIDQSRRGTGAAVAGRAAGTATLPPRCRHGVMPRKTGRAAGVVEQFAEFQVKLCRISL